MIVFYIFSFIQVKSWKLTGEGEEVVQSGSHEARLFNLVPAADGGIEQAKLMGLCGKWGKIGFSKAMSAGWITIDKSQVMYCSKKISLHNSSFFVLTFICMKYFLVNLKSYIPATIFRVIDTTYTHKEVYYS